MRIREPASEPTALSAPVSVTLRTKAQCIGDQRLTDFVFGSGPAMAEVRSIVDNLLSGDALPQTVAMLSDVGSGELLGIASVRVDGNSQIRAKSSTPWFLRRLSVNPYVNVVARDKHFRNYVLSDGCTRLGTILVAPPWKPSSTSWAAGRCRPSGRSSVAATSPARGPFASWPSTRTPARPKTSRTCSCAGPGGCCRRLLAPAHTSRSRLQLAVAAPDGLIGRLSRTAAPVSAARWRPSAAPGTPASDPAAPPGRSSSTQRSKAILKTAIPASAAGSRPGSSTPRRRSASAMAAASEASLISSRSCSSGVGGDDRLALPRRSRAAPRTSRRRPRARRRPLDRRRGGGSAGDGASRAAPAERSAPANRTSRLSAKWRKNVRSVSPARAAISATVVWSKPRSP